MIAADELTRALRAALPPELHSHAAALAELLVAAGEAQGDAAQADPAVEPLLRALAGQELSAGQALISFGAGNQLGDVAIGDIVGGNQTRISLQLSPTIAPKATGDVVIGQVGAGARGVAVGKNIIQIGALVVPAWSVLALAGLLLLAAAAGYIGLRGPSRMAGTFNVAVANFALDDGAGPRDSDEGRRLSAQAFEALRQQQEIYRQSNSADVISIWHDSLSWREKGLSIGSIGGATPADRERAARRKLADLGADMLIYGYIDGQGLVTLRFYVRPELQGEGSGSTIGGDYQVGQPLRPEGTRLTTRAGAIFWLLKGLQYDSEGRPDRSLDVLGLAESSLSDWRDRGEGKELLALFQAQAALYLAQLSASQQEFAGWLARAEGYVGVAERRDPEQLRVAVMAGHLGLLRAQCSLGAAGLPCAPLAADPAARRRAIDGARAEIAAAIAGYERAVSLGASSPDQLWSRGVAPAALGVAYYVRGEIAFVDRDDAAAAADYGRAAAAIGPALEALRADGSPAMLGEPYLALGSAELRGGDLAADPTIRRERYRAAADAFGACAALGAGQSDESFSGRVAAACAERKRVAESKLK